MASNLSDIAGVVPTSPTNINNKGNPEPNQNPYIKSLVAWVKNITDLQSKLQQTVSAYKKLSAESPGSPLLKTFLQQINQLQDQMTRKQDEVIATKQLHDWISGNATVVSNPWSDTLNNIYNNKAQAVSEITDYVRWTYWDLIEESEDKAQKTKDVISNARAWEAAIAGANANKYWWSWAWSLSQNEAFLKTQEAIATIDNNAQQQKNALTDNQVSKELNLYQLNSTDADNYLRQKALITNQDETTQKEYDEQRAMAYFNKYWVFPTGYTPPTNSWSSSSTGGASVTIWWNTATGTWTKTPTTAVTPVATNSVEAPTKQSNFVANQLPDLLQEYAINLWWLVMPGLKPIADAKKIYDLISNKK